MQTTSEGIGLALAQFLLHFSDDDDMADIACAMSSFRMSRSFVEVVVEGSAQEVLLHLPSLNHR